MKRLHRLPAWPLALCCAAICPVAIAQTSTTTSEAAPEEPPGGVLMRAMRDELRRTMRRLRMEQMESPYFVSYRVAEHDETWTMASFGASEGVWRNRERTLSVEVRVGDAELDNSNFVPSARFSTSPARRTISLPLDDNYQELRRRLWLTTDSAYKRALETLAKKRAALENRGREEVADFAPARPAKFFAPPLTPVADAAAMRELTRRLSALFRDAPNVHRSGVDGRVLVENVYYVNSEGTSFIRPFATASVESTASTQTPDGDRLRDAEAFRAAAWNELPSYEKMAERLNGMVAALSARREAEFVKRYNGPVLFEGVGAAEMLLQGFVTRLLGGRVQVVGDAGMQYLATALRAPFADRIGARVLPRFLDLRDDPTLRAVAGSPLTGGYSIDDDGVPGAPTSLVEKGRLKALLTTRGAATGALPSTGNRRGATVAPSNIVLSTDAGLPSDELRAEFLRLVAERGNAFGMVVRRLGMFDHDDQIPLVRAYKVFPDGREQIIRKSELVGLGDSTFKEIVAVSQRTTEHTTRHLSATRWLRENLSVFYGRRNFIAPVSVSTPDLLFEELTLRKPIGNVPRPPVAEHPYFDKP